MSYENLTAAAKSLNIIKRYVIHTYTYVVSNVSA